MNSLFENSTSQVEILNFQTLLPNTSPSAMALLKQISETTNASTQTKSLRAFISSSRQTNLERQLSNGLCVAS